MAQCSPICRMAQGSCPEAAPNLTGPWLSGGAVPLQKLKLWGPTLSQEQSWEKLTSASERQITSLGSLQTQTGEDKLQLTHCTKKRRPPRVFSVPVRSSSFGIHAYMACNECTAPSSCAGHFGGLTMSRAKQLMHQLLHAKHDHATAAGACC